MGSNGSDFYLRKEYVKRIDGVDVVMQNENPPEVQVPTGFGMGSFMQKLSYRPVINGNFNIALTIPPQRITHVMTV